MKTIEVGGGSTGDRKPPPSTNTIRPADIIPSLHMKTHFKAATSIFMNHKGSLQDSDKGIEKLLNDHKVKQNLK
jgi:hypothetical protein